MTDLNPCTCDTKQDVGVIIAYYPKRKLYSAQVVCDCGANSIEFFTSSTNTDSVSHSATQDWNIHGDMWKDEEI